MGECETLGAFIRARREAAGIGLRAFAKRLGVSATHLSLVERDKHLPSWGVMFRTACELDLDFLELESRDPRMAEVTDLRRKLRAAIEERDIAVRFIGQLRTENEQLRATLRRPQPSP